MLKNKTGDNKLNVEAMIRNIDTISVELKRMKDLHRVLLSSVVTTKDTGTARATVDQPALAAGPGEKTGTPAIVSCPEEDSGCTLGTKYRPVKMEDLEETERKKPLSEDSEIPDVSLSSKSFST